MEQIAFDFSLPAATNDNNKVLTFSSGNNTQIADNVDRNDLLRWAYGCYQRGLLQDEYRWSGADLRGKAASYGYHYAQSRSNLISRLRRWGYEVTCIRGVHRRDVVRIAAGPKALARRT